MNIDNINKTINLIRTDASMKFDMGSWGFEGQYLEENECGTACCIAGYAVAVKTIETGHTQYGGYKTLGMNFLGITEYQANELFMPTNNNAYASTKEQGIQVLEILRDTGKVDWDSVVGVDPNDSSYDEDEDY